MSESSLFEWIWSAALLRVRSTVDSNDVFATLQQGFQHTFAKRLLAMDDDTHVRSFSVPSPSGRGRGRGDDKRIGDQATCCKLSTMVLKVALGRIAACILAGSG